MFRVRIVAWSVFCLLLGGAEVSFSQTNKFDAAFNEGLKQEREGNQTEAIKFYLQAMEISRRNDLPRKRIEAIFRRRLERGESISDLKVLLPDHLISDLEIKKVFEVEPIRVVKAKEQASYLFWVLVALVVLGAAGLLFFKAWKKKKEEEEESFFATVKKTRIVPSSTGQQPRPSGLAPSAKKSDLKPIVRQETREEIEGMIEGVTSLTSEMKRPNFEALSEEKRAELESTDLVKALASTLLSEIKTREQEGHKYSRLTMDASLLFEEEDVEFFEKEFEATAEDIENAKRKDSK